MPKNLKGGNRAKKGKNSALRVESKLELVTEGQMYGICSKYYGNHRGDVLYYTKINNSIYIINLYYFIYLLYINLYIR